MPMYQIKEGTEGDPRYKKILIAGCGGVDDATLRALSTVNSLQVPQKAIHVLSYEDHLELKKTVSYKTLSSVPIKFSEVALKRIAKNIRRIANDIKNIK